MILLLRKEPFVTSIFILSLASYIKTTQLFAR